MRTIICFLFVFDQLGSKTLDFDKVVSLWPCRHAEDICICQWFTKTFYRNYVP